MTKIAIALNKPTSDVSVIHFLHKTLGMSLIAAKKCTSQGKKGFFFTGELYFNDHIEIVEKTQLLLSFFKKKNITLFIIQADEEEWDSINAENHQISLIQLESLLNESNGCFY